MRHIALLLALAAPTTAADIIGGSVTVFAPPSQTGNNNQQVNVLLGFNEQQNVTLTSDLSVGGVTIFAGTVVSSHYILYDPPGGAQRVTGNAIFDGEVLAILGRNTDLTATDALFGNVGTQYLSPGARGLESVDAVTLGATNEVLIDLTAGSPGDYVRVLTTAVPSPATGYLALMAFGLTATRRRSRSSAL